MDDISYIRNVHALTAGHSDIEESTQNMLEEELERAKMTIELISKERDQLIVEKEQENKRMSDRNEEMVEFEISALKKRLAEAKESGHALRSQLSQTQSEFSNYKRVTDSKLAAQNELKEKLRTKLQRLPKESEYLLLKEKVVLLQQQFLGDEHRTEAVSLPISASMDMVLNTKMRKLQSELSGLQLDLHSKNEALDRVQSECDKVKRTNEEQQELIRKLENDLMQKFDSNAQRTDSRSDSFAGHSEDTVTTNHNLYRILNSNSNQADDERKVKEDPSSVAIAIDVDPEDDDQSTDEYASMPLAPSNDSHRRNSKGTRQSDGRRSSAKEEDSAFLIICQQRDRFRNKAKDLESAKLRLESRMNRLSAENATLKKENVELYSKMKFLESYNVAKRNFTPQSTLSNRKGVKAEEIEMKYEYVLCTIYVFARL